MRNLVLELHPSKADPGRSRRVYIFGPDEKCIGYLYKPMNRGKANRVAFKFLKEYVISRESLLDPDEIEYVETLLDNQ